ncbi:hypothetical protein [Spirosoma jeollabukense]
MPLLRFSEQARLTVDEFYQEMASNSSPYYVKVSQHMREFVKMVNVAFPQTELWVMTSHDQLILMNRDDYEADKLIVIHHDGANHYHFEYKIPVSQQPWPDAYVKGYAGSLEEAQQRLIVCMHQSSGWPDSHELITHLATFPA